MSRRVTRSAAPAGVVAATLIASFCAATPLHAAATPVAVPTNAAATSTALPDTTLPDIAPIPPAGATQIRSAPTDFTPGGGGPPMTPPATTPTGAAPSGSAPTTTPTGTASFGSAPATDDIRDIRGPKGMFPLWIAIALAAALALLAAGGYGAWRWFHRQRKVRPLRPFEIALQRLEEVRPLMHPSSVREFSIAISDIVRRYIEEEFHLTATHRTTEEFLHDLLQSANGALSSHRNLLAHFLNQCDVAKFAAASLSARIMESLHESARSFVIETSKPAPAPTPEGPAPHLEPQTHDSIPTT